MLIPACASSSLTFPMMYSAYKLNKQPCIRPYTALTYSFPNFEPVCCSMCGSGHLKVNFVWLNRSHSLWGITRWLTWTCCGLFCCASASLIVLLGWPYLLWECFSPFEVLCCWLLHRDTCLQALYWPRSCHGWVWGSGFGNLWLCATRLELSGAWRSLDTAALRGMTAPAHPSSCGQVSPAGSALSPLCFSLRFKLNSRGGHVFPPLHTLHVLIFRMSSSAVH